MKGLQEIQIFKSYATRAAYREATGVEPPAYNPLLAPKHWEDPGADPSLDYAQYTVPRTNKATGDYAADPVTGEIPVAPLILDTPIARAVNIPGEYDRPVQRAVPVPIRPLKQTEKIIRTINGIWVKDSAEQQSGPTAWTHEDRAMLQAIARKLGL